VGASQGEEGESTCSSDLGQQAAVAVNQVQQAKYSRQGGPAVGGAQCRQCPGSI